ncbi:hypothetical protein GOHSU_40_00370 [Gordonia hirsuta DSM 44140 = NBRC 16056]|uniref:DUF5313 domain-containing protein n=1 Tax=Gordonia hirsuta DSM 44140 = NBRC 16056 TaxID=1121927 RepID=L7LEI5_9ACTN|nr:DUF5313 family protein [Gordonia hirsuta]GAC58453.1 hypothetical protein GOHSU_40_00370 [Gordonia hirsuta DSM 44140 = NBRC 16056]
MSTARPGPLQRIGYLLGRPLPPQMQDWVANDITGKGNYRRYLIRGLIPFLPIIIGLCFLPGSWLLRGGMVLILLIPYIYFQVALGSIYRRHLLHNNGLDPALATKVKVIRLSEAEELYQRTHRPELMSSAPYDIPEPIGPYIVDAAVVESHVVESPVPDSPAGAGSEGTESADAPSDDTAPNPTDSGERGAYGR